MTTLINIFALTGAVTVAVGVYLLALELRDFFKPAGPWLMTPGL